MAIRIMELLLLGRHRRDYVFLSKGNIISVAELWIDKKTDSFALAQLTRYATP
jgi:hypothetical protein